MQQKLPVAHKRPDPVEILSIRGFQGENHEVSPVDRNPAIPDVLKDWKIDQEGRITKRDGEQAYYPTNPTLFDYTTPVADRMIRDNSVITDNTEVYSAIHKKNIVVRQIGSTWHVWVAFGVVHKNNIQTLIRVYRGDAPVSTGEITWGNSYVITTKTVGSLDFTGDEVGNPCVWLDWSMVYDSVNEAIIMAIAFRHDTIAGVGPNLSGLRIARLSNILTTLATWQTNVIEADVTDLTQDEDVDGVDAVMSVDVELDAANVLHLVYEFYDSSEGVKYRVLYCKSEGDLITPTFGAVTIVAAVGDSTGSRCPRIVADQPGTAQKIIICYIADVAGIDDLRFQTFFTSGTPPGDASKVIVVEGVIVESPKHLCGAAMAVDFDGTLHFLYRAIAATSLYHARIAQAGTGFNEALVTDALCSLDYEGGIIAGTIPTNFCNWDLVVKNGWVTVYFVESVLPASTQSARIYKRWRLGTGEFDAKVAVEGYDDDDIVPPITKTSIFGYLTCYRKYESYGSRRLTYIYTEYNTVTGAALRDLKYLRNSRTAVEGGFDIEAITEYGMPQVDDQSVQIHVVQCSNNLYYKRNLLIPEWLLLENTFDVIDSQEFFWRRLAETVANGGLAYTVAPDPDDHARFTSYKGELRAGLGNGEKKAGVIYNLIDRRMFTNDEVNAYRDHFLDMQPLQAPGAANMQAAGLTYINNTQTLGNLVSTHPDDMFYSSINYRRFCGFDRAARTAVSMVIDKDFITNKAIVNKNDPDWDNHHVQAYFFALTFVYDGREESQLYPIGSFVNNFVLNDDLGVPIPLTRWLLLPTGAIWVGTLVVTDFRYPVPYLALKLQLRHWNDNNVGRTNPRVTAIRIWAADVMTPHQRADESAYYPVKQVTVGQKREFKAEIWKGEAVWTWAAPYWLLAVPIDLDDILVGGASGEYSKIQGHSWVEFKYEADKGLLLSPYPESYRHQVFSGGSSIIGNYRQNGVGYPNAISKSTQFSEQGFSAQMRDTYNEYRLFPFDVDGIQALDGTTILVIGRNGRSAKVNVPTLALIGEIGDIEEAVSPDTVTMALGNVIALAGRKLLQIGAYDANSIADPILKAPDLEPTTYKGLEDLTTLSDAWAFYLSAYRYLVLIFPTEAKAFVLDMQHKAWARIAFADDFACGCEGVDGELFFVDSLSNVRVFPSGTTDDGDAISPVCISGAVEVPNGRDVDLVDVIITYKLIDAGAGDPILRLSLIRDKAALSAVVCDFAASTAMTRVRRNIPLGNKIRRELAVKLELTTPLAAGEVIVESVIVRGVPQERVD